MKGLFPIKLQFFLTYAILGNIGPLTALILKDSKDFEPREIAIALAIGNIGLAFSPAIMTFLADRKVDSRKILRFTLIAAGAVFLAIYFLESKWAITLAWASYSVLFIPALPLLDGYYFIHEREHGGAESADGSYQFVRVWGTIGFLVPSIGLYFWMQYTKSAEIALCSAAGWCLLAFAGTFLLPPSAPQGGTEKKAPTLDAMRVLFSKNTLPMIIGLLLVGIAANAYYPYFSVHMKDTVGVEEKWILPIMSLGVALEVGYLLGLEPLRRLLRIKGLMILGLALMAIRLAALAAFPTVATSLIIQLFHGVEIIALFVLPIIYLDRVAGDGFRNSIQGAFLIVGVVPARLIGYFAAGEIATHRESTGVIYFSSAMAAAGMLVLLFFFKPAQNPARQDGLKSA